MDFTLGSLVELSMYWTATYFTLWSLVNWDSHMDLTLESLVELSMYNVEQHALVFEDVVDSNMDLTLGCLVEPSI